MTPESDAPRAPTRPPPIAFGLTVAVTGHRGEGLGDPAAAAAALDAVLTMVAASARTLHARETAVFAAVPPALVLLSALAEGADQIAAERAIALGFGLHAILPFAQTRYRTDFADPASAVTFEQLLAQSERVVELPGLRDTAATAYALAGRALVAHADILIAVWDGEPARGAGGTGEVVEHALRRGMPVIHVPSDGEGAVRLIWSGHDPHITHSHHHDISAFPLDAANLDRLLTTLLAPPGDAVERAHLRLYLREPERRWRWRLGYPLLFAVVGLAPRWRLRAPPYRSGAEDGDIVDAYAWADGLAAHLAQTYRSGHVFNFAFGALAVLLGLTGLVVPSVKLPLACAELAAIVAFVLNTRIGVSREWHRRWLDYRQLAERLRPMTCLAALGLAQPDFRAREHVAWRWVDWYAAGVWRAHGLKSHAVAGTIADLAAAVSASEIVPQIDYNRASALRIHALDHRLHTTGTAVFLLSCLSCTGFIVAFVAAHAWTVAHAPVFVGLSAGLPAIGTALFGIRVQGEFAATAARSAATADRLAVIAASLASETRSLSRVADLAEAGARAMLSDLGAWRLSNEQRRLQLP